MNRRIEEPQIKKVVRKRRITKKGKYLILAFIMTVGLVVTLASSYAALSKRLVGTKNYSMVIGQLNFSIENESNAVTLDNAYPMTDKQGSNLTPYHFTLKNTGSQRISYVINLLQDTTDKTVQYLGLDKVKFQISNSATTVGPALLSEKENLMTGIIDANQSLDFDLRLWLDYDATVEEEGKVFKAKIEVVGTQYIPSTYAEVDLNGADPVLSDNLTPVTIENDGTVKYADVESEWYNYTDKKWANAVVLVDKTINYKEGDTIPEANIESYFVWIPKYSYKIWNLGNYNSLTSVTSAEQIIDIKFGLVNTSGNNSGECTTPMVSGETGLCKVGDYMTHPAFISMNSNGLWIGKFETGYKGATSTGTAQVNGSDTSKIIIKPNTYSWRNIQPANSFTASYNYLRSDESHMMKNTEWGAVAYLQHSKYGSQSSVRINNNSSYLTGYAAVDEPTIGYTGVQCTTTVTENCNVYGTDSNITQPYNTITGYTASTTGNITGIYDMSGGAYEYVMGVIADIDGNPLSGKNKLYNSGFTGNLGCPTCDSNDGTTSINGLSFPTAKYFDLYKYGANNQNFDNRILGDATGEMGPFGLVEAGNASRNSSSWYGDGSWFLSSSAPWFYRGGLWYAGSEAGMFAFYTYYGGESNAKVSFRIILAP